MSKLFLLKSDHEEENSGDIIIDLDKVLTYRIIQLEHHGFLLALEYANKDYAKAVFDCIEKAKNRLKEILQFMGADPEMANRITLKEQSRNDDNHDKLQILKALLKSTFPEH